MLARQKYDTELSKSVLGLGGVLKGGGLTVAEAVSVRGGRVYDMQPREKVQQVDSKTQAWRKCGKKKKV